MVASGPERFLRCVELKSQDMRIKYFGNLILLICQCVLVFILELHGRACIGVPGYLEHQVNAHAVQEQDRFLTSFPSLAEVIECVQSYVSVLHS